MLILAASGKAGAAIESGTLGHGLLTYALLQEGLELNKGRLAACQRRNYAQ